nr:hypothetical protein Iba_chr13eCG10620 [Ipomoea batatas]
MVLLQLRRPLPSYDGGNDSSSVVGLLLPATSYNGPSRVERWLQRVDATSSLPPRPARGEEEELAHAANAKSFALPCFAVAVGVAGTRTDHEMERMSLQAAHQFTSTLETGEDTTLLAERERVMGRPIQSRSSATVVCCKLTICYATLRRGCRACCSSDHREEPPRRPTSAMADACQPPSRKLNWTPSFAACAWSYYHRSPTLTVIAANHGRSSIVAV